MRFVLVRHGQSENNLLFEQTGRDAGRNPDPRLTALGEEQAASLAAYLEAGQLPWTVTHVYSSLMARAIQTAVPVCDVLDLPLHTHPELFECMGPYQHAPGTTDRVHHPGSPRSELAALTERLVLHDVATEDGWWHGGFEAEEQLYADRAGRVIADLRERHADDDVVMLVSHGWFTQYLLRELLGIDQMAGWFETNNTAIALVREELHGPWTGTTTALRLNWTPHLEDGQQSI